MLKETLFALPGITLTVLCWGTYASVLHRGQAALGGDRLKPLICVGLAYFIIAIIVPSIILVTAGTFAEGWKVSGILFSMTAGACGALGALGIILALTSGGRPVYVMPLVFGGAPIINVIISMYFEKIAWKDVSPIFYAGMILVSVGAAVVLVFQPRPVKQGEKPGVSQEEQVRQIAPPLSESPDSARQSN
jgi:hypothetical protein